ncbi:RNAse III [Geothermobacter ehrlichii]|uniref:Ribonuclease 3 n=1 Tax=Geothermobacter ehrlichii TaxID=213224 RepID=A0A5D3WMA3_9BACT|nr:ribonuclease III [Geothermobacter ehrlichii]TYP00123.1 RNAse III [Geothermobacter ehrlichii]
MISDNLEGFQQRLGYVFRDEGLLVKALTHKSYANEHREEGAMDNERLEFLGDAVLDLAVSQIIFHRQPRLAEGEMTRVRAEVVSERSLAAVARRLGIGEHIRLGRGEELTGGREKDSLLADAVEAVLGAIFLDGGFDHADRAVRRWMAGQILEASKEKSGLDAKTRLQELLQAREGRLPRYVLKGTEGPDHARLYHVEVQFDGEPIGEGRGRTKKQAEQRAARQALEKLADA